MKTQEKKAEKETPKIDEWEVQTGKKAAAETKIDQSRKQKEENEKKTRKKEN